MIAQAAAASRRGPAWLARGRPVVVGILNITPDSFSDAGRYLAPDAALRQAEALVNEGAAMLDLGGESTRPGRPTPVSVDDEWRRLASVLVACVRQWPDVPLSVDTVKAEVARRALAEGASVINDVSALRLDPAIADHCAAAGAGLILMHSRGDTATMATYDDARYDDVMAAVCAELAAQVAVAVDRGVPREAIVLDPGLGFSKTPAQSLRVLRDLSILSALGHPVMIGPSRKRFLGEVAGRTDPADRDVATAAACVVGWQGGARLFRVHAPRPTVDALAVCGAVERA